MEGKEKRGASVKVEGRRRFDEKRSKLRTHRANSAKVATSALAEAERTEIAAALALIWIVRTSGAEEERGAATVKETRMRRPRAEEASISG